MAANGMDALCNELQEFLIRQGKHPEQVGDKLKGYTMALLRLLTPADELLLKYRYGLFGCAEESTGQLAKRFNTDEDTVEKVVAQCLRKMAITPEWQSIKPLTRLHTIRLK